MYVAPHMYLYMYILCIHVCTCISYIRDRGNLCTTHNLLDYRKISRKFRLLMYSKPVHIQVYMPQNSTQTINTFLVECTCM